MSPEQTQRWQEFGRELGRDPWWRHEFAQNRNEQLLRKSVTSRQAFYVAMTAYRKELARKQSEPSDDRY